MRLYELVFIVKSSLSESQRKKAIDFVKSLLKPLKIEKEEDWGQKALSYKIKGETMGYYYYLTLKSESEGVSKEIEKKIIANEDILRHLLLRAK